MTKPEDVRPFGLSPLEKERIRTPLIDGLERAFWAGSEVATEFDAAKEADATLAALASAPPAPVESGWRDIATAPKDGTDVLLCTLIDAHLYEEPATGRWDGQQWEPSWQGHSVIEHQGDFGTDWRSFGPQPTHWQPLPAAPTAAQDEVKP